MFSCTIVFLRPAIAYPSSFRKLAVATTSLAEGDFARLSVLICLPGLSPYLFILFAENSSSGLDAR